MFNWTKRPKTNTRGFHAAIPQHVAAALDSIGKVGTEVYARESNDGPAEILLYDQIDDWGDASAVNVRTFLNSHRGEEINVRVNSPGGLVYEGLSIYNALSEHDGWVVVTVDGLAYSAASMIAMAADHLRIHETADFGIHNAWGVAIGNRHQLRSEADWLENLDGHLAKTYERKTGRKLSEIVAWMDGEGKDDGTLFSGKESVDAGFADELIPAGRQKDEEKEDSRKRIASAREEIDSRLVDIRIHDLV